MIKYSCGNRHPCSTKFIPSLFSGNKGSLALITIGYACQIPAVCVSLLSSFVFYRSKFLIEIERIIFLLKGHNVSRLMVICIPKNVIPKTLKFNLLA